MGKWKEAQYSTSPPRDKEKGKQGYRSRLTTGLGLGDIADR